MLEEGALSKSQTQLGGPERPRIMSPVRFVSTAGGNKAAADKYLTEFKEHINKGEPGEAARSLRKFSDHLKSRRALALAVTTQESRYRK